MAALVQVKRRAVSRLGELGLDVSTIERVVRRADAEAGTCTALDPPIMEGLIRWGKTSRFLREELAAAGWTFDNPRNLARTIHPSGEFAVVAATGDEMTGRPDMLPATRYRKGDATVQAVTANEQLAFDFGESWNSLPLGADEGALLTWFLLFYADEHEFRAEVSLPNHIDDGVITGWAERIILPPFPRAAQAMLAGAAEAEQFVVEVSRR